MLAPARLRERVDRRGEAVVAQGDRLEVEREVAQLADRRARPRQCAVEDLARLLELAAADQVERRVEHERDAGERLHRPVVEEERDAAPLVLLGCENLFGGLVVGVGDVRLSVLVGDGFTSR